MIYKFLRFEKGKPLTRVGHTETFTVNGEKRHLIVHRIVSAHWANDKSGDLIIDVEGVERKCVDQTEVTCHVAS